VKRKPISKRTRFEVFKRDCFACHYCGAHPPGALLEIDHIIAVAAGGGNDVDNLVTACFDCNRGKGAVSLGRAPQSLVAKAAQVREAEEQLAGYAAVMQARRERVERDVWRVWRAFDPPDPNRILRDDFASIRRFVELIGADACIDVAERTPGGKYGFRYFCWVCWRKCEEAGVR
jgi:hypothetical protein